MHCEGARERKSYRARNEGGLRSILQTSPVRAACNYPGQRGLVMSHIGSVPSSHRLRVPPSGHAPRVCWITQPRTFLKACNCGIYLECADCRYARSAANRRNARSRLHLCNTAVVKRGWGQFRPFNSFSGPTKLGKEGSALLHRKRNHHTSRLNSV